MQSYLSHIVNSAWLVVAIATRGGKDKRSTAADSMRSVFRARRAETYSSFSLRHPRTTPTISYSTLPRSGLLCHKLLTPAIPPTRQRPLLHKVKLLPKAMICSSPRLFRFIICEPPFVSYRGNGEIIPMPNKLCATPWGRMAEWRYISNILDRSSSSRWMDGLVFFWCTLLNLKSI
jgi:hypothetical protein